ncbi:MAG TPA: hypothetical protein VG102_03995 [Candidatus Paceibacterota bacterium]|nr:hypothetical protein [Candidatus Paceibacterota bacterium]
MPLPLPAREAPAKTHRRDELSDHFEKSVLVHPQCVRDVHVIEREQLFFRERAKPEDTAHTEKERRQPQAIERIRAREEGHPRQEPNDTFGDVHGMFRKAIRSRRDDPAVREIGRPYPELRFAPQVHEREEKYQSADRDHESRHLLRRGDPRLYPGGRR